MLEINKIVEFNTLKVAQANHVFNFKNGTVKFTGKFLYVTDEDNNQVVYHVNGNFNAFEINKGE